VWLTFFGEYRGHGHPHESPAAITGPLIVLGVLSVTAGFLNATAFEIEKFTEWAEPRLAFPPTEHHPFSWGAAGISVAVALLGILLMSAYYSRRLRVLEGLTQRNTLARAGYTFLWNKYYLDHLYEGVIVKGVKGPIARAANWVNAHVLDGFVNGVAKGAAGTGRFVYRYVDQGLVDGLVNGSGHTAEGSGGVLRRIQSGRVQQYGALLFGAAAVGALVLVLTV
jgi:NADH-quinone oxidoreductase subunit L